MYNKNRHKKIKPIKQTKGKDVFLCIFDHWALYAQTVFCLRAAAVILNMSRDVVLDDRMRQYPLVHGHPIAMTVWNIETKIERHSSCVSTQHFKNEKNMFFSQELHIMVKHTVADIGSAEH